MLLIRPGEVAQHQDLREIADYGMFVLEIIVQAEALFGEMLADNCHAKIGAIHTTVLLWEWIAIKAGTIRQAFSLRQQRLPG